MRRSKPPPFELPAEPVDQYEVRWWSFDPYSPGVIRESCAVYHANTDWKTLFPDSDRDGAPFKNEWAIFCNGTLTGRRNGWREAWLQVDWSDSYDSRVAVLKAAGERVVERITAHEQSITELRAVLSRLTTELTTELDG